MQGHPLMCRFTADALRLADIAAGLSALSAAPTQENRLRCSDLVPRRQCLGTEESSGGDENEAFFTEQKASTHELKPLLG
ncbi:hypothetical protein NDU88_004457 [Pleurodeles waltl]|uniref:Uncharacterized protein n=1 Tax=Pleurodeles waltl TaxID=8319 RepID=A0AAV7SIZ5_PLEWA|nr:hypothetical protein NDU88_004457 [Pleurodeles waltl]